MSVRVSDHIYLEIPQLKIYNLYFFRDYDKEKSIRNLLNFGTFLEKVTYEKAVGDTADFEVSAFFVTKGQKIAVFHPDKSLKLEGSVEDKFNELVRSTLGDKVNLSESSRAVIAEESGYVGLKGTSFFVKSPLLISSDQMSAVFLKLPVFDVENQFYAYSELFVQLNDKLHAEDLGVKFNKASSRTLVLKQGVPPVHGKDEILEFLETANSRKLKEKNKMYPDVRPMHIVEQGEKFARMTQKTAHKDGVNIYGKPVPAKQGQVLNLAAGEGVRFEKDENGADLYAEKEGAVIYDQTHIRIEEDLFIEKNVDFTVGHLLFPGNIEIQGDIKGAFSVECAKTVTVHGNINSGAQVTAASVVCENGIYGAETKIKASQSVTASFVQQAYVSCGGDVTIKMYLMNGRIRAKGTVVVEGEKKKKSSHTGAVIGGSVNGVKEVRIHSAGSPMAETTVLASGVDLYVTEHVKKLNFLLGEIKTKVFKINRSLPFELSDPFLKEKIASLKPYKRKSIIADLKEIKNLISRQKKLIKTRDDFLKEDESDEDRAVVMVSEYLVPDVMIYIGEYEKKVIDKVVKCSFSIEDGEIIMKRNQSNVGKKS